MDILMLVGSLRADSWTAQLSRAVADLLPEDAHARVYDGIGRLPHYDQDLDGDGTAPMEVVQFRRAIGAADALVVATPEYNGSVTGVLKNAIDWASRPRGASSLDGKPVAVLSVSPSPRGAQWAREDLVRILAVAGAKPLEESVGVATVHDVLDGGRIVDHDVRRALSDLVGALVGIEQVKRAA
jgi:chromate reductase